MWLYIWLAVTALALMTEFLTNKLICIWFVGGSVVAAVMAGFQIAWYYQLVAFAFVSAEFLALFRKKALRKFGKEEDETAQAVIGKEYKLLTAIKYNEPGTIRIEDTVKYVMTENGAPLPAGTIVKVKEPRDGKYVVTYVSEGK